MTYISKIEIGEFGKFRDYRMTFGPGLNEFILENEFGKSTITDFIVFMLYGFTKTGSSRIPLSENYLKKYLPWNGGGIISGAMELIKDGDNFRIERTQRASGRGSFVLRKSSGEELPTSVSPGVYFFGVDCDTYLRTFALRQTDMVFFKTDGIETALKNLVTTGDEETSFEGALTKLKEKKSQYQHGDRRSGRIFNIPKEIAAVNERKESFRKSCAALEESAEKLNLVQKELKSIDLIEKDAREQLKRAKANDGARALGKLRETDLAIKECENSLGDKTVDEDSLDLADSLFTKRDALLQNRDRLETDLSEARHNYYSAIEEFPRYEFISGHSEEINALANAKSKVNGVLLILGILLMLSSLPLIPISIILGAAVLIAGAVLTVLAFIFRTAVKIPPEFGMTHKELCEANRKYIRVQSGIELKKELVRKAEKDLEGANRSLSECESLCSKSGFASREEIVKARSESKSRAIVENQLGILLKNRKEILGTMTEAELEDLAEGGDAKGISEDEALEALHKITEKKQELISLEAALSKSGQQKAEYEQLIFRAEREIEVLEKELSDATYSNEVLDIAITALCEAYDRINSIYSPIVTEKARETLIAFTGGKYDSLYLDRNFEIRLKSGVQTNSVQYFSRGTREAVYFAIRNAVADILSEDGDLPILLDDPYWALDTERTKTAKEFLKGLSGKKQIIVFSAK